MFRCKETVIRPSLQKL